MSEQAPELKRCPFCGEGPERMDDGWMHRGRSGCWIETIFIPEREVWDWNRRADIAWLPDDLVERVKYARDAINEAHPTEYAALHLVEGARHIFRDILAALRSNVNMGTVSTQDEINSLS